MGKLGEVRERKFRSILKRARDASREVDRHQVEDGAGLEEKEAVEVAAWEDVYRFVTDDEIDDVVYREIFGERTPKDTPNPEGTQ